MSTVTLLEKTELVEGSQSSIFMDLMNPRKYSAFFDNTFLRTSDDMPVPEHFQFVATVSESNKHSYIHGTINSARKDESFQELDFEWNLRASSDGNKTKISYRIYNANEIPIMSKSRRWSVKTALLVSSTIAGIAAMSSAYAATGAATTGAATTGAATTGAATTGAATTGAATTGKSIAFTKPVLAAITMLIISAGSGGILGIDAYYSDPYVEYLVDPQQMPAELHGTSIIINNVHPTDGKSEIVRYDCDNESIVYRSDYSFDCVTENSFGNKETITTTVSIREPRNQLNAEATECVSQHYKLPDDVTTKYPYLLNLPNISPSALDSYKDKHIKIMDDSFEHRDYKSAREHATIVLRYFNINDVQALSTLGNIMRDEDRSNKSGVQCAVAVHGSTFLYSTSWGKLSLAEDYHVQGKFQDTSSLASQIIEQYESGNPDIHETTYKNALIIKANALFRMAMAQQADDVGEIKKYYSMAHDIEESYDSWFGLGNLDRYKGNFADALKKYENAKSMALDTTEIDYEMSRVLSYLN